MAASVSRVTVPDRTSLDSAISSYIVQGYVVQNRGDDFVVMFKKKEFSVLWAVVGLILCLIPLLIYLIVYAAESDKMVEIRVTQPASVAAAVQYSEDGNFWWDPGANQWRSVGDPQATSVPEQMSAAEESPQSLENPTAIDPADADQGSTDLDPQQGS